MDHKVYLMNPSLGRHQIKSNTAWTFITRTDANFVSKNLARWITNQMDNKFRINELEEIIEFEYLHLFDKFMELFSITFIPFLNKGNVEIHVFDEKLLVIDVKSKAKDYPILSLDPLIGYDLQLSKGFKLGGIEFIGTIERPGTQPITQQINMLKDKFSNKNVVLVEDSFMTGETLKFAITNLLKNNISIKKIVTGIQLGYPTSLLEFGIPLESSVTYEAENNFSLDEKVEIFDQRELVMGLGGLATLIEPNKLGRAPYILPFVSISKRYGVPEKKEIQFSLNALQATAEFYSNLSKKIKHQVLLKEVHPYFSFFMHERFGVSYQIEMIKLIDWTIKNIKQIWNSNFLNITHLFYYA